MCKLAGFVGRHIIPLNSVSNSQTVNLTSNESSGLAQVNPNMPQPVYQPRMGPMPGSINSGVPISSTMSSMHQQHPGVGGSRTQSTIPSHPQPQISNLGGPQHPLPTRQPMMSNQHQQPMMGQLPYGASVHMGQYGPQSVPSQQVNPQPSAPNHVEQPKVEQPQVAELISFD